MREVPFDPKFGIRLSIVFLLISLGLIVLAIFVGSYSSDSVTCGDEVMQPGATCVHYTLSSSSEPLSNASASTYNYDQQKSANDGGKMVWAVLIALWGIIFCVLGIVGLTLVIRKLRSTPPPSTLRPGPMGTNRES